MKRKRGWKKPIIERARSILHGATLLEPITGDDDQFLRDLIALHPEAAAKIGVGIAHFEVRPNDWGKLTFWLVRTDGTETDFSFLKALSPPSPEQDFAKACRHAVADQIIAFKAAAFATTSTLVCPVTHESVTESTCHIDHSPPWTFEEIVRAFAAGKIDLAALVQPTRDGDLITRFRDQSIAEEFSEFHRLNARLRVVSVRANLSVLRR